MIKAVAALGVLGFVVLLALAVLRWSWTEVATSDAVSAIALQGSLRQAESPDLTAAELERMAVDLGRAGAIHVSAGPGGRPLDPYGTPFRIEVKSRTVIRATSAGPDRRFDTGDDAWVEVHRGPNGSFRILSSWDKGS